ncbi:hypothetical protein ACLOJK_039099 [Asimina triloba]
MSGDNPKSDRPRSQKAATQQRQHLCMIDDGSRSIADDSDAYDIAKQAPAVSGIFIVNHGSHSRRSKPKFGNSIEA